MMKVIISQKAMKAMESLPRDVQVRARRVVEYLKTNNEEAIKSARIPGSRNLYYGVLKKNYRVVYTKTSDCISIVDFIRLDLVSSVMRSDI